MIIVKQKKLVKVINNMNCIFLQLDRLPFLAWLFHPNTTIRFEKCSTNEDFIHFLFSGKMKKINEIKVDSTFLMFFFSLLNL